MLDGTDEVVPERRQQPRSDGGDGGDHRCAECGKTFDTLPSLRGHAGGTGHDIHGRQPPSVPARSGLRRARGLLFDGDVGRGDLVTTLIGVAVGISLALSPEMLGTVGAGGMGLLGIYRVLMRLTKGDLQKGVQYLDTLVGGALFGFVVTAGLHSDSINLQTIIRLLTG
jgi:hypothetical protein